MRIAVLLATYNRRQKTVSCLNTLFWQKLSVDTNLSVYLTDDNSTDDTAETVSVLFPDVKVFHGTGSLFWAGGMRNSWHHALNGGYDYYLLLNDDTTLKSNAVASLIACAQRYEDTAICVGSTLDTDKKIISYGGHKLFSLRSEKSYHVASNTELLECDMANANIMLVPAAVVGAIGILDDSYTHSIADFDYTLRAKKAGFKIVVAPGVLGYCVDDHGNNWKPACTPLKDRIKYLKSPKGLAYHEYLHFIKEHFPLYLPVAFLKLWLKTLFPGIWDKFKLQHA